MADKPKTPHLEPPAETPSERESDLPASGPHAEPHLTDEGKTPGTGVLPEPGEADGDATTG